jgi:uncharacterized protein involved in exopolysaccharide biosynthesis
MGEEVDGMTEERPPSRHERDEIDLGEYFVILRKAWWKIVLFSLAAGLVTLLVMLQLPDIYQATAVITPALEEKKPNPALGVLASFGVDIGSPTKVEDLETLFKSNDLTVRVFRKYNLWPVVLPGRFDPATGKMKFCWTDRLFRGEKGPMAPSDWDAIRVAKDRLKVFVNRKVGTISVSFESPSAEGSADIVKYYLDEGKSRLQEETLDRAVKNKEFIEEQIGKTVDALTRDRLYSLYGQEVEREMMGRNREQFGFRVVDAPRVPDRKVKPRRGDGAILACVLSFFAGCIFFVVRGIIGRKKFYHPEPSE